MSNSGKKVKVHYTGTLDDGTKFDSSHDRHEPLAFTCMAGQMIPGFDAAVEDMAVGETKTVHLAAKDAYGERDESLTHEAPVEQLPEGAKVGDNLFLRGPMGQTLPCRVTEIANGTVVLDMNHELAGKDLNFEITLLEVSD